MVLVIIHYFSSSFVLLVCFKGDMVRYLPDGNLEYCGRRDRQIKFNGIRMDLYEVELLLETHPRIDKAVVLLRDTMRDEGNHIQQLVAFIIKRDRPIDNNNTTTPMTTIVENTAEIQKYFSSTLPSSSVNMVPSLVISVTQFPLNYNGKIDRPQLLKMMENVFRQGGNNEGKDVNDLESLIHKIWSDLLKVYPNYISLFSQQ